MTPKEKAKELFNKYFDMKWQSYNISKMSIKSMTKSAAKQCALIAVEEILKSHYVLLTGIKAITYNYWQEVKEEIEKL